ncbi:peptidoglycan editing factor PgeF [Pseudidiomarina insulisalsae]|uniref:Purine nucleoside phosphorylase n=1 Tax=Pseudidiomarina insulisalsae TaxID=575789 RepID=A0A432YAB7_9GAMM|nr:peptidoglycan editing factor PgeF [Pseudidiomarina insulisalsae]RUO57904.1 peptidoglycan editing factor PgeF [Pseudidiomarina insulisalsae]
MPKNSITPAWVLPKGVRACVTTTTEPGNLAAHVGDDPATVLRHRRQLQRRLHLPVQPKWLAQCHGTRVVQFETARQGAVADAIWTQQPASVCAVLTADCLPILLCSDDGQVIAAIHAGWRGLAAGIITTTLAQLPVAPQRLSAYIGPAISVRYFEVGDEVRQAFATAQLVDSATFHAHNDRWLADLPLLAERMLERSGIADVVQSGLCTFSDPRFDSYRRDRNCGRIASLIWKI